VSGVKLLIELPERKFHLYCGPFRATGRPNPSETRQKSLEASGIVDTLSKLLFAADFVSFFQMNLISITIESLSPSLRCRGGMHKRRGKKIAPTEAEAKIRNA
jgi:hypothetical protein